MVTVAECKDYLRIPTTVTVEDALIERLILAATGMIEGFIGRPIEGEGRTFGTVGGWPAILSVRRSNSPGTTSATATAIPPLSDLLDYGTRIEPAISQDIIDVVAMLYHQRSPTASSESEGGGISQSWGQVGLSGLPTRVERRLLQYRAAA